MKWTDEMREWFRAFTPGHSEAEIGIAFADRFGIGLTRPQIKNAKSNLGVRSGTVGGRFEKGHVPANKGKTWAEYGTPEGHARSRATTFRKGHIGGREGHIKPVGAERVSKDGYIEVKVGDGLQERPNANYRFKHHLVYEQAYGPIPSGCNVVFADHDKTNLDPGNLVAVDRGVWAVIRKMGYPYCDRESLEACINLARLKSMAAKAAKMPRMCRDCGSEFDPEFDNQSRCRPCIDKRKGRREEVG